MVDAQTKIKFNEFLHNHNVAVISTVSLSNQPMSATIYFVADEQLNFYFMTKPYTRKNKNIQHNKEVALVIGTENTPATIQVQGIAERVSDAKEIQTRLDQLVHTFAGNTFIAPLFQLSGGDEEILIYKITPTWIRWLDLRESDRYNNFVQILPEEK